ncbi:hypothetical protein AAMO2058_001153300 [Amorphochlora amoebiformis]
MKKSVSAELSGKWKSPPAISPDLTRPQAHTPKSRRKNSRKLCEEIMEKLDKKGQQPTPDKTLARSPDVFVHPVTSMGGDVEGIQRTARGQAACQSEVKAVGRKSERAGCERVSDEIWLSGRDYKALKGKNNDDKRHSLPSSLAPSTTSQVVNLPTKKPDWTAGDRVKNSSGTKPNSTPIAQTQIVQTEAKAKPRPRLIVRPRNDPAAPKHKRSRSTLDSRGLSSKFSNKKSIPSSGLSSKRGRKRIKKSATRNPETIDISRATTISKTFRTRKARAYPRAASSARASCPPPLAVAQSKRRAFLAQFVNVKSNHSPENRTKFSHISTPLMEKPSKTDMSSDTAIAREEGLNGRIQRIAAGRERSVHFSNKKLKPQFLSRPKPKIKPRWQARAPRSGSGGIRLQLEMEKLLSMDHDPVARRRGTKLLNADKPKKPSTLRRVHKLYRPENGASVPSGARRRARLAEFVGHASMTFKESKVSSAPG